MKQEKQNVHDKVYKVVKEIVTENKNNPVNFFNSNNLENEFLYIDNSINRYAYAIKDIIGLFNPSKEVRILEVGTYFGIVALSLSKLGYSVVALDIPEFINNKNLQEKFLKSGICFHPVNLKEGALQFDDNYFDVVVFCEVLEHLNFNPIPTIKEFNRVLKENGYVYLSVPNILSFLNRKRMLLGKPIFNPVDDYFRQINPNDVMIVDMHWREYTQLEVKTLFEKLEFMVEKQYYLGGTDVYRENNISFYLKKIFFDSFPRLKGTHISFIKKVKNINGTV